MKLINPSEISGKILTLLDESDKYAILVSPYCKISKWFRLTKKIEQLKSRKIPLYVFVRAGEKNNNTFNDLNQNKIDFQVISNLHCKLYLNEKYGIVTSLNLLLNSEINSLEIGYITENEQELSELLKFCKRYLNFDIDSQSIHDEDQCTDIQDIIDSIQDKLEKHEIYKRINIWMEKDSLRVNTGINNYYVYLENENNENILSITGILSGKEFDILKNKTNHIEKLSGLDIEIVEGEARHYDTIKGISKRNYLSKNFDEISSSEVEIFEREISTFVYNIDLLKNEIYENR